MEIDEETGKYAKGTSEPDEIEEILHGDETEIAERLAGEFDKKQFMEGLGEEQKQFFADLITEGKGWTADAGNKHYAENFMYALLARAQKDTELKNMLSTLQALDKRLKTNGGSGFKFSFHVNKKDQSKGGYRNGVLRLNLDCWMAPHRKAGGSKTMFSATFHEIMHALVDAAPAFNKLYLNALQTTIKGEMEKVNAKAFTALAGAKNAKTAKAALKTVWQHYVDIAKANGNEYWQCSLIPFTDFTHSIISENLTAKQISRIIKSSIFADLKGVGKLTEAKGIGFHSASYCIDRKDFSESAGSVEANEFIANAGSLYFTDRNLFKAYAKEMPDSFGAIEKLIKSGGSSDAFLYFSPDKL
jgi:hypothetical protein